MLSTALLTAGIILAMIIGIGWLILWGTMLYDSASKRKKGWFIAMFVLGLLTLVFSTVLMIIYYFTNYKKKKKGRKR